MMVKLGVGIAMSLTIGMVLVFLAYGVLKSNKRMSCAPKVRAEVLSSSVKSGPSTQAPSINQVVRMRWYVDIEYRYQFNGQTYTGNAVTNQSAQLSTFFDRNATEADGAPEALLRVIEEYSAGMVTEAYVDPKNPQKSFLIYESKNNVAIGLSLVGFLFLGIAGIFSYLVYRNI